MTTTTSRSIPARRHPGHAHRPHLHHPGRPGRASVRPVAGAGEHRARARPTAPVRVRRRRLAVVLAVASIVGGAAVVADGVVSGPGGVPASAAGTGAPVGPRVVRAAPGDSLWSIAAEHRGAIPITRFVEALIQLNGGTRIEAGQLVRLP
jgi:Tfp pilus assembly protein FimV